MLWVLIRSAPGGTSNEYPKHMFLLRKGGTSNEMHNTRFY